MKDLSSTVSPNIAYSWKVLAFQTKWKIGEIKAKMNILFPPLTIHIFKQYLE